MGKHANMASPKRRSGRKVENHTVAVVTVSRNRPLTVKRVCDCLLEQRFKDIVWIVVSETGGQADAEAVVDHALCNGMAAKSVVGGDVKNNRAVARNLGLRQSESPYVVFLDDDDSWDDRFLETTVDFLNTKRWCSGVVVETFLMDEEISHGDIRMTGVKPWNPGLVDVSLESIGAWDNPFSLHALLFRRSVFDRVMPFDESLDGGEDFDFFLRFIEEFDIAAIPEPLVFSHRRTVAPPAYLCPEKLGNGEEARAMVRDRLLRRDLARGRMGVGMLSELAVFQMNVATRLARYRGLVDYIAQQRKRQG